MTLAGVTPGMVFLMWSRRLFSRASAFALSAESPTRSLGINAFRMTLRQFPDERAKITHNAGVVPLFINAFMFAEVRLLYTSASGQVSVMRTGTML